jgi:hypothetical protein
MKKIRDAVKITTGIREKTVIVTIDCSSDLLAGKYLALMEAWLEDIAARHPRDTKIVEGRRK